VIQFFEKYTMKAIYLTILMIVFCNSFLFSQSCLPEGITFSTQTQIDNFQVNYPGCTEIEGFVKIEGPDITHLTGLSVITAIGGTLTIGVTENLETLSGLGTLQSIGGNFAIGENSALVNLSGLESLSEISGNFWIFDNNNLTNVSGFVALVSIGETISIYFNPSMSDLSGLSTLNSIGDAIYIDNNDNLGSLAGLDNIDPNSILNLLIINNDLLSTCDVESICGYLANPNGIIEIFGNASGCDSQEEVQEACDEITVEEVIFLNNISIFPNPADDILTIKSVSANKIKGVKFYNQLGERVLQVYPLNNIMDISTLPQGMYIIEVEFMDMVIREKLITK